jgi:hypothetical protein
MGEIKKAKLNHAFAVSMGIQNKNGKWHMFKGAGIFFPEIITYDDFLALKDEFLKEWIDVNNINLDIYNTDTYFLYDLIDIETYKNDKQQLCLEKFVHMQNNYVDLEGGIS